MSTKLTENALTRRRVLDSAGMGLIGATAVAASGRSAEASEERPIQTAQNRRNFQAIDWSINAWLPGGIGARFAGIGHRDMGVCNNSAPWGLPYSRNRREELIRGYEPEFIIERFDMAGVEKGGLLACWAAEGVGGKDARVEADEVYEVVNKHPTRFFGIVGASPVPGKSSKYYGPDYIRYAITQLGFKAVHMYPHWFGVNINDQRMYPILETCADLDVPFLFQLGFGTGMANSRISVTPERIDDIVRDFPTLKICGIHLGSWPDTFKAMVGRDLNVYWGLDAFAPSRWAERGFVDYLMTGRGPGHREQLQNYQDKVFWGTDFPVQDWVVSLQEFDELGLPEEVARKVLRDNVVRLFKLEA